MSGKFAKFGGGGTPCTVCAKTVYPAETVQFEQKPYHSECFACKKCKKIRLQPSNAALFDGEVYCRMCFKNSGFAQKQTRVKWEAKKTTKKNALSGRFGGGGQKCTVCTKTVYPAETVQFEKKPYHSACFACSDCKKNKLSPSDACQYDEKIYCRMCFKRGGYAQKQTKVKWKKSGTTSGKSKFGGGGNPCTVCSKTVYPAETVQYEGKVYHAGCFKCGECKKKLNPSDAAQYDGNVYCKLCFGRGGYAQKQAKVKWTPKTGGSTGSSKFGGGGTACVRCSKTVYPAETIQFETRAYHEECFKCANCKTKTSVNNAEWSSAKLDMFCRKCFMELRLNQAKLTKTDETTEETTEAKSEDTEAKSEDTEAKSEATTTE